MRHPWAGALGLVVGLTASPAWAGELHVQFPGPQHRTQATTIMVIGSAGASVKVAGQPVPQSSSGHFATRVPLALGPNRVEVEAGGQRRVLVVTREALGAQLRPGQLMAPETWSPAGALQGPAGSWQEVSVQAAAGAQLRLWSGERSWPLSPLGAMALAPDSKAVLTGGLEAPQAALVTHAGQVRLPEGGGALPPLRLEARLGAGTQSLSLPGMSAWAPSEAWWGEVVGPLAGVTRSGPSTDHSRLAPLAVGSWVQVVGLSGAWARLGSGAWIQAKELKLRSVAGMPPATVRAASLRPREGLWRELRLTWTHPVAPTVEATERGLRLRLPGVRPEVDLVGATPDEVVKGLRWGMPGPDLMELDLDLGRPGGWGHRLQVSPGALSLLVKAPPRIHGQGGPLGGARILLDPGHGGPEDPGCADPLGRKEADRSLPVALELAQRLRARGAEVRLTRESATYLGLAERAAAIETWAPDLALSLHWNALPDGGDPAHTQGIGTFWFHPQAQALAQDLHAWLTQTHGRPSYGVFWDNLALTRPVACPSVLLELGFLTHPQEAEWAADPEAMRRLSEAIAQGLEAHLLKEGGAQVQGGAGRSR